MATTMARPAASEHNEYFGRYITLVPDGDMFETLTKQIDVLLHHPCLLGVELRQSEHHPRPRRAFTQVRIALRIKDRAVVQRLRINLAPLRVVFARPSKQGVGTEVDERQ